jgi:hypothetical protein
MRSREPSHAVEIEGLPVKTFAAREGMTANNAGVLQLGACQGATQEARVDQCVDLGVHILHARVRQQEWGSV